MRARLDERSARIPIEGDHITADLLLPRSPRGVVLFVHGSGSSRRSTRNRAVARTIARRGLATVLVDLLTSREEVEDARTQRWRFDIELLTRRTLAALDWLDLEPTLRHLPVGLFGASTGAAAAIAAAARRPEQVRAVVSRGGRPDLAGASIERCMAPTLLLVGSRDVQVLRLNEQAGARMRCVHELREVQGATHLFGEPGTLELVADHAAEWLVGYLAPERRRGPYADRSQAGRELADAMHAMAPVLHDPIVLALPRGGVPVAIPVARMLEAPLDVVVARKVGAPLQPELALGAVDEDGALVADEQLRQRMRVSRQQLRALTSAASEEARARAILLRAGRPLPDVRGHDVVLVDDGVATGMTARAAASFLHRHGARRVVLAVPVAPIELVLHPPPELDAVTCPYTPRGFGSVGQHYRRFEQVDDANVRALLGSIRSGAARSGSSR